MTKNILIWRKIIRGVFIIKKCFELPPEVEKQIIEISEKAKEINLDNLEFEYKFDTDFYKVSLTDYRSYWQIVHRGHFKLIDRADIYKLSFDGILEYEYSEHD